MSSESNLPTDRTVQVIRKRDNKTEQVIDRVAVEVPIALVYNGISHVVMMATPNDLQELAYGFSLTEGVVDSPAEIYGVEAQDTSQGIELNITISERRFQSLKEWRRNMTGRTGCGLCGSESLGQALRLPPPVIRGAVVEPDAVSRAMAALPAQQAVNLQTGATHAAAWADINGNIIEVREDVGRHNALDKLLGALCQLERPDGFLLVTSRASYEMVQKAGWANIGLVAAVSAPTSLAIELADKLNITLLGFTREENFVVYANSFGVAGI